MSAHDWRQHVYDDRASEALYGHPPGARCARCGVAIVARVDLPYLDGIPRPVLYQMLDEYGVTSARPYDLAAPCDGDS